MYRNNFTQLTIPSTVTYIGASAFNGGSLTQLVIPGSVKHIDKNAFSGNNITSLTISDGVACIGDEAFLNNNLTQLILPDSATYIGNSVAAYVSGGTDTYNMRLYRSGFYLIIAAGADTGDDSFGNFYRQNGKKAGRYTPGGRWNQDWSYSAR
jgi:hypothetical protein